MAILDEDALVAPYRRGSDALAPGGRFVILDFKLPSTWIAALAPLLVLITKPFGVSLELCERHPWESVSRFLDKSSMKEYYFGFAYLAAGEKVSGCGAKGCP